jgi:hypothetical protein
MRLAMLVLVVAKNTRELLSIASELAFLAGLAMAGAKSPDYFRPITARLKSCSDTWIRRILGSPGCTEGSVYQCFVGFC